MFTVGLFTITKIWKQCMYSLVGKWIKKMGAYICTQQNVTQALKKKKGEILPFLTTQMDLEGIGLSE